LADQGVISQNLARLLLINPARYAAAILSNRHTWAAAYIFAMDARRFKAKASKHSYKIRLNTVLKVLPIDTPVPDSLLRITERWR
jgi:hypothetical protein